MTPLRLDARRLRPALLTPPVSKSDALRALTLAAILEVVPPDVGPAPPEDVRLLCAGLQALRGHEPLIECGDGAGPFRVLLGQAAVRPGTARFTGSTRLGERPHAPLVEALRRSLGAAGLLIEPGDPWPWRVRGAGEVREAVFRARAVESSQFATSLLLAAAARARAEGRRWAVELEGPVASGGYLELTLRWLARMGFGVEREAARFTVAAGARPAAVPPLPRDWSSAGYLLLTAWRSGGAVCELDSASEQPDRGLLRYLEEIGLTVTSRAPGTLEVQGDARAGVRLSASDCPDLVPTLAALACVLPLPSRFTEVGILRGKESDRLAGSVELARAGGAATELAGDALVITPGRVPSGPLNLSSHGDHRMAMAAALLAVCLGKELHLEGSDCVAKSFPGFFQELSRAGVLLG
ncbi:MAG: 3-phosphoshikimate 1-carboxyvinyltransferase [Myxococcales bacterium]